MISMTFDTGIEYAIPSTPSLEVFAKLIAITLPSALSNAPPLLPELIAAFVIKSPENVTLLTVIERFVALIIPFVTDWPSPNALPIATTSCPMATSSLSASSAIAILLMVESLISERLIATTAISLSDFEPFTVALTDSPSTKTHFKSFTSLTTCAFVTTSSSLSFLPTIIPVPLVCAS